jgi:hypothetical protein
VQAAPGGNQLDAPRAGTLLCRLQAAGGIPGHAVIMDHKGRADWLGGDLLYRLSLKQGAQSNAQWTLFVGDRQWGRPFHEGGILALVPIRPALGGDGEGAFSWPVREADVALFVAAMIERMRIAAGFVRNRRDLCDLLLAPGDVVRGEVVADLHADRAERVVRALAIAQTAGDLEVVAQVLELFRTESGGGDAPTSLRNQAHFWADQWTYQSGQAITVPDTLDEVGPARQGPAPDDVEDFWDRLG